MNNTNKENEFEKYYRDCGYVENEDNYNWLKGIFIAGMNVSENEKIALKAELEQQRFNNEHNLSIDQKVSDEIAELKAELEKARELIDIANETLSFYADINNCEVVRENHVDARHIKTMSGGLYMTGKRASEALGSLIGGGER